MVDMVETFEDKLNTIICSHPNTYKQKKAHGVFPVDVYCERYKNIKSKEYNQSNSVMICHSCSFRETHNNLFFFCHK